MKHRSSIKKALFLFSSALIVSPVITQAKFSPSDTASVQQTYSAPPLYKNPSATTDERVADLLGRMTIEEKIGQLSTLLGWDMYDKKEGTVTVSEKFTTALQQNHIGMLWATLRADPWTKKTLTTGLNPRLAAIATNAIQKYAVEQTRLGIPMMLAEECPHGHMAIGTTVFPTSIGQSSTWNPALIQQMAAVIAKEARLQGAHIGYGPILDLARELRWSRMEETYGEDPVLNGVMGKAVVQGLQGSDINSGVNVISTLKHFAAYGIPEGGHNGGNVNIGQRELLQYYMPPFKEAVNAGALSVMSSYNSIDGVPCTGSKYLMDELLRKQWGFKGFVVSDLGSIEGIRNNHYVAETPADAAAMALNAGVDADLGGNGFGKALTAAIQENKVDTAALNQAVGRVLRLKFNMGLFEHPYVDVEKASTQVNTQQHKALAAQVAREAIVLLKNEKATLPLSKGLKKVAVIGPNADNMYNQLGDYTAPQPDSNVTTVLEGIRKKLGNTTQVTYVKGCAIRDTANANIAEAVKAARQSDVVIVVLGGSSARDFETEFSNTGAANVSKQQKAKVSDMESGEGFDRISLDLLGRQLELLQKVAATGKPVVLVMIEGRPLNINWAAEHIPAIINAWYPGQEGGNAIADVLFGDYNPAGRLPVSIPKSVGQLPVYYDYKRPYKHDYVESDARPLYPFGHGLSYSSFTYSNMQATLNENADNLSINVSLNINNSSKTTGDEVVQLYVTDEYSSVVTPVKQLKAFSRVEIKAGESKSVSFTLTSNDLKLLNNNMQWVVEPGNFIIMAGASSEDIRLKQTVRVSKLYQVKE
ncbi:glycoside hydrolase family 3 N-terminal domain-containing protein [Foetidibacter luteolus]|uniref:glycoside hydrolase family 3 N-terminal domain-containing protein n=1 Tax=Foetidibacter luteolus TaxID=2608880 RepID=UPI00129B6998|nr:glycoside hydrolase family 3 N-terminal domain-containing protein [Foetidibacter luteolus]